MSHPLRIRSPHDAISAVPYLLGFHPADSLVAVGFDGPHSTCVMRLDLPHLPTADLTADLARRISDLLSRNRFRQALLLGYGAEDRVAPAMTATRETLTDIDITVREALRVAEGRWWSYLCDDPRCCPPEGTPFDITTSVIAAHATFAGQVARPDRPSLERTVAPATGPARQAMRQATDHAEERFLNWSSTTAGSAQIRHLMFDAAIPILDDLAARTTAGADAPSDDEIAWLGVLLTNLRVRDEAWIRIDPDNPAPHITFWRDVLRRVEEPYAAAPGCLLAYAAYISGNGGLANVALDRAIEADPTYTLTALLRELIMAGVPPSKARLTMTPAQLAAAYTDQDENRQAS